MCALVDEVQASATSRAALDHLHRGLPLLSTVVTIIQTSGLPSQTDNAKNRTDIKAVSRLCVSLQELLEGAKVFAACEDLDGLLVSCLAKCAVALVMCMNKSADGDKRTSEDEPMEEEDPSQPPPTKKSKKQTMKLAPGKDDAHDATEVWDSVLEPILEVVLTHIGMMKECRQSGSTHGGSDLNHRRADDKTKSGVDLPVCLEYVRMVCDITKSCSRSYGGQMLKIWSCVSAVMTSVKDDQLKGELC